MNNYTYKWLLSLLCLAYISISCESHAEYDDKVVIEQYTNLEMYKYDTLKLEYMSNTVDNNDKNSIFTIVGDRLYITNPDNIVERVHKLKITTTKAVNINLTIKIRDWKTNEYKLQEVTKDNIIPLLTKQDTMFFLHENQLKYTVNNGKAISCGRFELKQPYYNEFVAQDGMYALRIHETLYMSNNLKNWRLIYKGKRGINKSMTFVRNPANNALELLFSEYTPGAERFRHHIYKYNFNTKQTRTVMTFYKRDEGMTPFARHIHILEKDPYTGDIWVGTGDTDDESHIYRSTDNGETFYAVGTGSQKWRVLAFIFTPDYIFWNVDSHEPQYLTRINRRDLVGGLAIDQKQQNHFSIINSACWGVFPIKTSDGKDMWVMSSNNEGGIYDNYCRTYGFILNNDVPTFYELAKIPARTVYTQLYPIGVKSDGTLVLYDHEKGVLHNYIITK